MTELTDATFYAPLKTTLVPTNGAGTPTFTRSTTKNIFDNEGKLITVKSGAVALGGARCVQNWCRLKSEDLTSAAWVKLGVTTSAQAIVSSASTGAKYVNNDMVGSRTVDIGESWLASFRVQYVDIQYVQIFATAAGFGVAPLCNFDLINGDYTATGCTASMTAVSSGVWDITANFTSIAGNIIPLIYLALVPSQTATRAQAFAGDGIKSVGVLRFQLENVTGQSVQAVGEYISVGVLSAPYHGGGADGVKYFDTDSSGNAIADATMLGAHIDPASKTNNLLWCRDLTNAAWVKTNATSAKTQAGIDGLASSCSLLTANADNATILQTITAASTPACSGFWVKRSVGAGSIFFTRNGGVDWLDITSLINSSTFTCVKIENTSVTNPQVGFKIATSGDAIIVDAGLNHAGTTLTLPIFTKSSAITRAADVLTYQTASNFSDTAGTILATYKPTYDTYAAGSIVGSATRGLYAGTSNSGVQALDGTNTINGPAGTPSGQIRIGARWSGSSLQCFALDSFGSSGSYDGSFNLSTIGILPGTAGYIRDLAIWTSSLTDNEISDAWNLITASSYITSGSLVGMQSILSSSASSISTVIYGSITATYAQPVIIATYVQPTLTATYTVPTIEAEP